MTPVEMLLMKEKRLADDLARLGPRPPWWRPFARRRHDRRAAFFKQAHAKHLDEMLRAPNDRHAKILAHLIGWRKMEPSDWNWPA